MNLYEIKPGLWLEKVVCSCQKEMRLAGKEEPGTKIYLDSPVEVEIHVVCDDCGKSPKKEKGYPKIHFTDRIS